MKQTKEDKVLPSILGIVIAVLSIFYTLKVNTQEINAYGLDVCGSGTFKSYMSMTMLNTASPQYQYLINNTYDDGRNLRVTNDGFIAVAMGSYYGVLGDKFYITFADGTVTPVVKVDEKADAHTSAECRGKSMGSDGSIIEVITSCGTYDTGNCSNIELFNQLSFHGNAGSVYPEFAGTSQIVNIEKLGEVAESREITVEEYALASEAPVPEVRLEDIEPSYILFEGEKLMVVYIPNEEHKKLLFLDTEFNEDSELVQAAFILLEAIDETNQHFFLTSSLNIYVQTKVSEGFENYTGIKQGFLGNEGFQKEKAIKTIEEFLEKYEINEGETLVIGHGVSQDLKIIDKFGIGINNVDIYDTLRHAKRILNRGTELKQSDIVIDAGYVPAVEHDAYVDASYSIVAFGYLKFKEFLDQTKNR